MKGVAILGSTGSIGENTLNVISNYPENFFVASISCNSNVEKLKEQIKKFRPINVCVGDKLYSKELKKEFPEVNFFSGEEGIRACIESEKVDIVVMGIVGFSAIMPSIWTLRENKTLAMANKEALVVAGNLLKREKKNSLIIPVDSEHSAIFQLINGKEKSEINSLILTATGGPFFNRKEDLYEIKKEDVLKHPVWKMGPKISVDSATMVNKAMEIVEAHFLFDIPDDHIKVWIHPQGIVHSLIELCDNSLVGQFSVPDMKGAISYALSYPKRLIKTVNKLTFEHLKLEFYKSEEVKPLKLARYALKAGQCFLVAFNAANEVAVQNFLKGRINFIDIIPIIEKTLETQKSVELKIIEDVLLLDAEIRDRVNLLITKL